MTMRDPIDDLYDQLSPTLDAGQVDDLYARELAKAEEAAPDRGLGAEMWAQLRRGLVRVAQGIPQTAIGLPTAAARAGAGAIGLAGEAGGKALGYADRAMRAQAGEQARERVYRERFGDQAVDDALAVRGRPEPMNPEAFTRQPDIMRQVLGEPAEMTPYEATIRRGALAAGVARAGPSALGEAAGTLAGLPDAAEQVPAVVARMVAEAGPDAALDWLESITPATGLQMRAAQADSTGSLGNFLLASAGSIAENAPQLAVQYATAMLTGGASLAGKATAFAASAFPMEFADSFDSISKGLMEQNPGMTLAQARAKAALWASSVAAVNTMLERVEGGRLFAANPALHDALVRRTMDRAAKNFVVEGVTETMQEGVGAGAEYLSGADPTALDANKLGPRLAIAGVTGGVLGGMGGAVAGAFDHSGEQAGATADPVVDAGKQAAADVKQGMTDEQGPAGTGAAAGAPGVATDAARSAGGPAEPGAVGVDAAGAGESAARGGRDAAGAANAGGPGRGGGVDAYAVMTREELEDTLRNRGDFHVDDKAMAKLTDDDLRQALREADAMAGVPSPQGTTTSKGKPHGEGQGRQKEQGRPQDEALLNPTGPSAGAATTTAPAPGSVPVGKAPNADRLVTPGGGAEVKPAGDGLENLRLGALVALAEAHGVDPSLDRAGIIDGLRRLGVKSVQAVEDAGDAAPSAVRPKGPDAKTPQHPGNANGQPVARPEAQPIKPGVAGDGTAQGDSPRAGNRTPVHEAIRKQFSDAGPGHAKVSRQIDDMVADGTLDEDNAAIVRSAMADMDDGTLANRINLRSSHIDEKHTGKAIDTRTGHAPTRRTKGAAALVLRGLAKQLAARAAAGKSAAIDWTPSAVTLEEVGHIMVRIVPTEAQTDQMRAEYDSRSPEQWAAEFERDGFDREGAAYAASSYDEWAAHKFYLHALGRVSSNPAVRGVMQRVFNAFKRALQRFAEAAGFVPDHLLPIFEAMRLGKVQTEPGRERAAPAPKRGKAQQTTQTLRPEATDDDMPTMGTDGSTRPASAPRGGGEPEPIQAQPPRVEPRPELPQERPAPSTAGQTERPKPPPMRNVVKGRESVVRLADGGELSITYAMVEADELTPSHDARANFAKNEAATINERNYHLPDQSQMSRAQVSRIANSPKPDLLYTDTPSATDGPPIVDSLGRVLGGNARTMGVQLAYFMPGSAGETYRKGAAQAASKFGIDPAAAESFQEPVIVRMLSEQDTESLLRTDDDEVRMSAALNEALTAGKTAETEAVSKAARLSPASINAIIAELDGYETLSEALENAGVQARIIRAMAQSGAWGARDTEAFVSDGKLNGQGRLALESALLGTVIRDVKAMSAIPPSLRNMMVKSVPSMLGIREAFDRPDSDVQFDGLFADAIKALDLARASGSTPLEAATSSLNPAGMDPVLRNPRAVALAEAMHEGVRSPRKFADRMARVVGAIREAANGQIDMMAGRALSPGEAFDLEMGVRELHGRGLFSQDEPDPTEGVPLVEVRHVYGDNGEDRWQLFEKATGQPLGLRFVTLDAARRQARDTNALRREEAIKRAEDAKLRSNDVPSVESYVDAPKQPWETDEDYRLRRKWRGAAEDTGTLWGRRLVQDDPGFRAWFGDSQIRHGSGGTPKVVYHGTPDAGGDDGQGIQAFDRSKIRSGNLWGQGFYTTDRHDIAGGSDNPAPMQGYAQAGLARSTPDGKRQEAARLIRARLDGLPEPNRRTLSNAVELYESNPETTFRDIEAAAYSAGVDVGDIAASAGLLQGSGVIPAYLRMERPLRVDSRDEVLAFLRRVMDEGDKLTPTLRMIRDTGGAMIREAMQPGSIARRMLEDNPSRFLRRAFGGSNGELARQIAERLGYDGLIERKGATASVPGHDIYVVFDQDQIKSVFAESFTRAEPRLLYGRALPPDSQAFRDWFKGSTVVDGRGRPLVAYHGTPDGRWFESSGGQFKTPAQRWNTEPGPREALWFTSSMRTAKTYADDRRAFDYQGADPSVIPVYLRITNPLRIDGGGRSWSRTMDAVKRAQEAGHDGIIITNVIDDYNTEPTSKPTTVYAVFSGTQVKHATRNAGTYGRDDPRSLFGRVLDKITQDELGFYSRLEGWVGEKMRGPMPAGQLRVALKNAGLPADEIKWTGIDDWLAEKKGEKVTPEQVREYLSQNRVVLKEKVLGGRQENTVLSELVRKRDAARQRASRILNQFDARDAASEELEWQIDKTARFLAQSPEGTDQRKHIAIEGAIESMRRPYGEDVRAEMDRRGLFAAMREAIESAADTERELLSETPSERPRFANTEFNLPGGSNYREVLLTLPEKGALPKHGTGPDEEPALDEADIEPVSARQRRMGNFQSSHFSEPNIIAHMRIKDRVTPDRRRVLFLEEVQSDWGESGRDRGFRLPAATEADIDLKRVESKVPEGEDAKHYPGYWESYDKRTGQLITRHSGHSSRESAMKEALIYGKPDLKQPPPMPWSKNWHEMVLRRAMRLAAQGGYDAVGWTTGKDQIDRYEGLARQVEKIEWEVLDDGVRKVFVALPGNDGVDFEVNDGKVFNASGANAGALGGQPLRDVVGADLAKRIMDEDRGSVRGPDIRIGGDGMRNFYDRDLVNYARKYGKKWGAEPRDGEVMTGPVDHPSGDPSRMKGQGSAPSHLLPITPEMRNSVLEDGQPLFGRFLWDRDDSESKPTSAPAPGSLFEGARPTETIGGIKPWNMTADAFTRASVDYRSKAAKTMHSAMPAWQADTWAQGTEQERRDLHRTIVKYALARGVPASDVMRAEYPDLVARYGEPSPPVRSGVAESGAFALSGGGGGAGSMFDVPADAPSPTAQQTGGDRFGAGIFGQPFAMPLTGSSTSKLPFPEPSQAQREEEDRVRRERQKPADTETMDMFGGPAAQAEQAQDKPSDDALKRQLADIAAERSAVDSFIRDRIGPDGGQVVLADGHMFIISRNTIDADKYPWRVTRFVKQPDGQVVAAGHDVARELDNPEERGAYPPGAVQVLAQYIRLSDTIDAPPPPQNKPTLATMPTRASQEVPQVPQPTADPEQPEVPQVPQPTADPEQPEEIRPYQTTAPKGFSWDRVPKRPGAITHPDRILFDPEAPGVPPGDHAYAMGQGDGLDGLTPEPPPDFASDYQRGYEDGQKERASATAPQTADDPKALDGSDNAERANDAVQRRINTLAGKAKVPPAAWKALEDLVHTDPVAAMAYARQKSLEDRPEAVRFGRIADRIAKMFGLQPRKTKMEPAGKGKSGEASEGQRRAKEGGEFGSNGEWYPGGSFINTVKENPKGDGSAPSGTDRPMVDMVAEGSPKIVRRNDFNSYEQIYLDNGLIITHGRTVDHRTQGDPYGVFAPGHGQGGTALTVGSAKTLTEARRIAGGFSPSSGVTGGADSRIMEQAAELQRKLRGRFRSQPSLNVAYNAEQGFYVQTGSDFTAPDGWRRWATLRSDRSNWHTPETDVLNGNQGGSASAAGTEEATTSRDVMGVPAGLVQSTVRDGVSYELYAADEGPEAFVRIKDVESGEVVTVKRFPGMADAKAFFDESLPSATPNPASDTPKADSELSRRTDATAGPSEPTPPDHDAATRLLRQLGIEVSTKTVPGGRVIHSVTGNTYAHRDAIKSIPGNKPSWYGADKSWSFWNGDPTVPLAQALAGASRTGDQAKPATGRTDAEDLELLERRKRELDRPDERAAGRDVAESVGGSTADLIRLGAKAGIPDEVLGWQIEDIGLIRTAFERKKPMFLLGSAPGSGKTFVIAGAIRELKAAGAERFVWVTMNQTLIDQIKSDVAAYGIGDSVQFATYADLSGTGKKDSPPIDASGAVLVLDEAHNVKNVGSNRGRTAMDLIGSAKFTLFSSATPFEDPVQAKYLDPTGIFGSAGGHDQWAILFGAQARKIKVSVPWGTPGSRFGKIEKIVPVWVRTKEAAELAKGAKRWFEKQGILSQRPLRLPPNMVVASFERYTADPKYVELYERTMEAYDAALGDWGVETEDGSYQSRDAQVSSLISMHSQNAAKRILEAAKVAGVIERAKKAAADGRKVVIFVETKSDRALGRFRKTNDTRGERYTYPEIRRMMQEWRRERDANRRMGEYGGPPAPFSDAIESIAMHMHEAGLTDAELPSVTDDILAAIPDAMVFTGEVPDTKARENLDRWRKSQTGTLVATMAKGGTGLSLHDKLGGFPTAMFVLNMPWTATQLEQVSGRINRYGLASIAHNYFLFADNIPFERKLAGRIGGRLRSMNATVKGLGSKAAASMEDFNFEDRTDVKHLLLADEQRSLDGAEPAAPDLDIFDQAAAMEKLRNQSPDKDMDYFATPYQVAAMMAHAADVRPGDRVLEPSAGEGNLLRFLPSGAVADIVEPHGQRRAMARGVGEQVGLEITDHSAPFEDFQGGPYSAVVMNPPFSRVAGKGWQDITHVKRAYSMLAPNGRLVAIMSEGPFFREDAQSTAFREWLDEVGATVIRLPEGAFKDSGTMVRARMIVVDRSGGNGGDLSLDSLDAGDVRAVAESIPTRPDRMGDEGKALHGRAFHGSPHTFEKFDISKIGTGEGVQAYGYGLYFASNREVAEHYRNALSYGKKVEWLLDGKKPVAHATKGVSYEEAARQNGITAEEQEALGFIGSERTIDATINGLRRQAAMNWRSPQARERWNRRADTIERMRDRITLVNSPPGRLYEVDLKPAEDEYLLWDKPISEQSAKVKRALLDLRGTAATSENNGVHERYGGHLRGGEDRVRGSDLYHGLTYDAMWGMKRADNPEKAASEHLRSLGIRGIKYLDGNTRNKDRFAVVMPDGTEHGRYINREVAQEIIDERNLHGARIEERGHYNYVVFDDADVEIRALHGRELSDQTETPEFKRWFGNSKVVDENGKPLVVYHGSYRGDIEAFDPTAESRWGSNALHANTGAVWFSSDPASANHFTENDRGAVYPVYLRVTNPLIVDASKEAQSDLYFNTAKRGKVYDIAWIKRQALIDAQRRGHDGVIFTNAYDGAPTDGRATIIAVFSPTQIKSATGNRGTFDPSDPSILHGRAITDPPPDDVNKYVKWTESQRALSSTYYEKGADGQWKSRTGPDGAPVSSRTTPQAPQPYKVGQWRIDDGIHGIYGHEIAQLREVPLADLILIEDDYTDPRNNDEGRGDDARRYAEWMREGRQAPPIEVIQRVDGHLVVSNGHRRTAAAKMAGKPTILAWVNPLMPTGEFYTNGKPILTGLTYEGAKYGASRAYQDWNENVRVGQPTALLGRAMPDDDIPPPPEDAHRVREAEKAVERKARILAEHGDGRVSQVRSTLAYAVGRADTFLRTLGPAGKQLASESLRIANRSAKRGNTDEADFKRSVKDLSRADREIVAKIGQFRKDPKSGYFYRDLRPDLAKIADGLREIADRSMKMAASLGVERAGKQLRGGGGWYPQVPNAKGRAFMETAFHEGLNDPSVAKWADEQVADGKFRTPDAALGSLMRMRDDRLRGVNRYLESYRTLLPIDCVEWDLFKTVPPLLHKNALLVEAIREWGVKFEGARASIETIAEQAGGHWRRPLKAWLQASFDQYQHNPISRRVFGAWSNFETLGRLAFSPISAVQNYGQQFVNTAIFGYGPVGKALAKYPPLLNRWIESARAVAEKVDRSGATSDIGSIANPEQHGAGWGLAELGLKVGGFVAAERANQVRSAIIAYEGIKADFDRLLRAKSLDAAKGLRRIVEVLASPVRTPTDAVARRVQRFTGMSDAALKSRLLSGQRLTEAELEMVMVRMTRDTQFVQDLASEPAWFRMSPFLRLATKFKTWGTRQVGLVYEHVLKEARRGNFGPLVRLALAAVIAGELVNLLRDLLRGKDESLTAYMVGKRAFTWGDVAQRIIGNMRQGGAFGLLLDMTYGMSNFIGGPALNTLENAGRLAIRLTDKVSSGDAGGVLASLDAAATEQLAVKRLADDLVKRYRVSRAGWPDNPMEWRTRTREWLREQKYAGLSDRITGAVRDIVMGRFTIGDSTGSNVLPYRNAAHQIDVGDVDDAADYLYGVLRGVEPAKVKDAIGGIRQSMLAHSPLGAVAKKDLSAFLSQFPDDVRAKALDLHGKWIASYSKAMGEAIRRWSEEHRQPSGSP